MILWLNFDTLLIQFWHNQKCLKYTLIHSKTYQIMIDDRNSYINGMQCVWNGMKKYQILGIKNVSKVYLISFFIPILISSKVYQSSARVPSRQTVIERSSILLIHWFVIQFWKQYFLLPKMLPLMSATLNWPIKHS